MVAALSLIAFWALLGKYVLLRGELDDTRNLINQGSLVQPATSRELRVSPDRAAGIDRARIVVTRAAPQLLDVHIDLGYTDKLMEFRLFVDKKDQGRALVLNNLLKDSNGEFHGTGGGHLHCADRGTAVSRQPQSDRLADTRGALNPAFNAG